MVENSQDKQTTDAVCGKDSQKTFVQDFNRCEVEDEGTSKRIRKGKSQLTINVSDGFEYGVGGRKKDSSCSLKRKRNNKEDIALTEINGQA
ncbi:hypothetical protein QJS10_CPB11g01124 [Acorus calamus]|uniref:Uncharacterized protein n=1 Tax=Acorus calamus TaxID=4465 RepID=A0AAV9DYF5_ACOCL|nr:hypothetical protein QJS10_CPB11g01124 [Acorus calamus]